MTWTIWILSSAFFLALYDLAKKASVRENAVLPTLLLSTLFGGAAFAAALAARGALGAALAADASIVLFAAAKAVIVATSWIFTFNALRTLPISIATPIRASAPALVFLVAAFVYGEIPTPVQAVGMAAVFAGYFVFSWAGRREGIDFFRNRAVWSAFAGMVFSALSALFDKFVFQVQALPVEPVQLWFQVFLFVFYALVLAMQRALRLRHDRFSWRWSIPLVGVFLVFADWLYFNGLACPDVPISVASLMRRFSVVITFVLGARFFHETNLRRKSLALAAVLLGIVLLCL